MRVACSYYGIGPNGTDKNVSGMGGQLTNADGTPTPAGTHAFAELFNGTALGGLAFGTSVLLQLDNGGSATIQKLDNGTASVYEAGGVPRAIDLWEDTLPTLGITDKGQGVWFGEATVLDSAGNPTTTGANITQTGLTDVGISNDDIVHTMAEGISIALGPFVGLVGGQNLEGKMEEFVIRSVEVVGGMMIISLGAVLLAYMIAGGNGTAQKALGIALDYYSGGALRKEKKLVGTNKGTASANVKPRVEGGMTTAQQRLDAGKDAAPNPVKAIPKGTK